MTRDTFDQIHYDATNSTDRKRCFECGHLVPIKDIDNHTRAHGGTLSTIEPGLRVGGL